MTEFLYIHQKTSVLIWTVQATLRRSLRCFFLAGLIFGTSSEVLAERLTSELVGKFAPLLTRTHATEWVNSQPLTWGQLNGRVVLLELWNVGSWSSIHSLPWLRNLYAQLKPSGFEIVAVHSPQFPHEKNRIALQKKLKEFEITYPIMLDEDSAYAQVIGLATRPLFILIDKRGKMHSVIEGEVLAGSANAKLIETSLRELTEELR